MNVQPIVAMIKPKDQKWRKLAFELVTNVYFSMTTLLLITANTVFLAAWSATMSKAWESNLRTINLIFTGLFTIEFLLKISAYGKRYFIDNWNKYDFFNIVFSVIGWLIDVNGASGGMFRATAAVQVLRMLKLGHVLKLCRKLRSLNIIYNTIANTMDSIFNIFCLILLTLYIYSVAGIHLFANVKMTYPMNYNLNF